MKNLKYDQWYLKIILLLLYSFSAWTRGFPQEKIVLLDDNYANFLFAASYADQALEGMEAGPDRTPPPSPDSLTANGHNPSLWRPSPIFTIAWINPPDESGIRSALYKFGAPPRRDNNFHGIAPAQPPVFNFTTPLEGNFPLYVWLMDSSGNRNFETAVPVWLRYDSTRPHIDSLKFFPQADLSTSPQRLWFRSDSLDTLTLTAFFDELHPDSLFIAAPALLDTAVRIDSSGLNKNQRIKLALADVRDSLFTWFITLRDSAGNWDADTLFVGFDRTAPESTIASSPQISTFETFTVSWSPGTDGHGIGIARYVLWLRADGLEWVAYDSTQAGVTSIDFTGTNGHFYDFEVVAVDSLDHRELRTGIPESGTRIDINFVDTEPPAAPIDLMANGSNPSPWQKGDTFFITWQNPPDYSGIKNAHYRLDKPPAHPDDYQGTMPPAGNYPFQLPAELPAMLFVWLVDGAGNSGFKNTDSILLRRDSILPLVYPFKYHNPAVHYSDGNGIDWYNQNLTKTFGLKVPYQELYPDSAILRIDGLNFLQQMTLIPADTVDFQVVIGDKTDGKYPVSAEITDFAGNRGQRTQQLGLDGTAPQGALAQSDADTSAYRQFTIRWAGGDDGDGVGLNGLYTVRYQEDDGPWLIWQQNQPAGSALFRNGRHGHLYRFEAATFDLLANAEEFRMAETTVFVDTVRSDTIAPGAPEKLLADGASPSPWKKTTIFTLTWVNPDDQTGISGVYHKVGTAPTSNDDFTGFSAGDIEKMDLDVSPFINDKSGQARVYLWLRDGNKNRDYRNNANVLLRYDNQIPVIHSLDLRNPTPPYYDGQRYWYNQAVTGEFTSRVSYSENYADSVVLIQTGLGPDQIATGIPIGQNKSVEFTVAIKGKLDGRYEIRALVTDSAANRNERGNLLGLDATAPTGTLASAHSDTSTTSNFTIRWGGGVDGTGVGLAGRYTVRFREDNQPWQTWQDRVSVTSAVFTGRQGHRYEFEAGSWDWLDNLERFTERFEAFVVVDTIKADQTPPGAPINLRANGANPGPWQEGSQFQLTWQNPPEQTWIARAYYKMDRPPRNNNDYTNFVAGTDIKQLSVNIQAPGYNSETQVPVWVWLEDAAGNRDYLTATSVRLRRDAIAPRIQAFNYPKPDYGANWFDTAARTHLELGVTYTEPFANQAMLSAPGLWPTVTQSGIPVGNNKTVIFNQNLANTKDGAYQVIVSVNDSLGHLSSASDTLRFDGTPPVGVSARSPAATANNRFTVQWTFGNDGVGVGIASYEIWYRDNGSPWRLWRTFPVGTNAAEFNGENGHKYEFEARGVDYLGHQEPLTGNPETVTLVDSAAPSAPELLSANGANPSPWSLSPIFELSWQNPDDLSGVVASRYKIGTPPTGNQDTTGQGPARPPFRVSVTSQGQVMLYLWLVDAVGNQDYRNASAVLLRHDSRAPVLDSLNFRTPAPLLTNNRARWYRQDQISAFSTRVFYSEDLPDSLILKRPGLGNPLVKLAPPAGMGQFYDFSVNIANAADGIYPLEAGIVDQAGGKDSKTLIVGLDRTPPINTLATVGVDTVASRTFLVSWPNASDGAGVGLSGLYSVKVKTDNGAWQAWKQDIPATWAEFKGQHGHWYAFEAATRDLLGNSEPFTGQPEARVFVDTTRSDTQAPPAPINLLANGSAPSPWQSQANYRLTWQFPGDQTGISKVYFKFINPPSGVNDFDGSDTSGNNHLTVDIKKATSKSEDSLFVYVWLQDGVGNVDPKNWARVLLRYDALPPQVHALTLPTPGYTPNWYQPQNQKQFSATVTFSESRLDSLILTVPGFMRRVQTDRLPSGNNQSLGFSWDFSTATDGEYNIVFRLVDRAGNITNASQTIRMDGTAPSAVQVTAPAQTNDKNFTLKWSEATDAGVGVGGYELWHRSPGGNWALWKSFPAGTSSAVFNAEDNRIYEFELMAADRLGNKESRQGQAEARTLVDATAPAKPIDLLANGTNPSPWQKETLFTLTWRNPPDLSGIAAAYYKWDAPPSHANDWAGFAKTSQSLQIEALQQGENILYLWLADSLGNQDYRNHSRAVLRTDYTAPKLDALVWKNPAPEVINEQRAWYNPGKTSGCELQIQYTEVQVDSVVFQVELNGQLWLARKLPGAEKGAFNLKLPFQNLTTGRHQLKVTLSDSALNQISQQTLLGLDDVPPQGATTISPPVTNGRTIIVQWGGGDDGDGVGLSGYYGVQYREKTKPWQIWHEKTASLNDTLIGEFNKTFEFEAAAWDQLGNRELFTGTAESQTTIDPSFNDLVAPSAPELLSAGGSPISPWQKNPEFKIDWLNPYDPSGIRRSYFKLDTPPTAAFDTSGRGSGKPPIGVRATRENGQPLYLWLEDNARNIDFNNSGMVVMRYDSTRPVIHGVELPPAHYRDNEKNWYNPNLTETLQLKVEYTELHPDSIHFQLLNGNQTYARGDMVPGARKFYDFDLSVIDVPDGENHFAISIRDSAGNVGLQEIAFWSDRAAPVNTIATAPDTAISESFVVSWSGSNVGSDGNGSGLSGEYDLYVQVNAGKWERWLTKTKQQSATFSGKHWHSYGFQACAWDKVGNVEVLDSQPECQVFVDTTVVDRAAPAAPRNLAFLPESENRWQNQPSFTLTWDRSEDASGIRRSLYKLDAPPLAPFDTTGTGGSDTLRVIAAREGGQPIYIWLEDQQGNLNHLNHARERLRYDTTRPVIKEIVIRNQTSDQSWFNQLKTPELMVRISYAEAHPARMELTLDSFKTWIKSKDLAPGPDGRTEMIAELSGQSDGSYQLKACLTDSAGNRSDSLQIAIILDSQAPQLQWLSVPGAIMHTPLTLQAEIRENRQLLEARLFYRSGGAKNFDVLPLQKLSGVSYGTVLASDRVTSRGLEFYLQASDGPNVVFLPESGAEAPAVATVKIVQNGEGLRKPSAQPTATEATAYRMISLPVLADARRVDDVLGDDLGSYDKTRWRFFEYNSATSEYIEYPQTSDMAPGKAFWLITSLAEKYVDSGVAHSLSTREPFEIKLRTGWNDIGLPFDFPVAWDSIRAHSILAESMIGPYTYDGDWQLPSTVKILMPWEGYSIYTTRSDAILRIPAIAADGQKGLAKNMENSDVDWQIRIEARCQNARDLNNFLGCAQTASDSLDAFDYLEPHPVGAYVSLYFVPSWRDWPGQSPTLTTDFRSPFQTGAIWPFEVTSNLEPAPIRLNFEDLANLPEHFVLALVDRQQKMRVDLMARAEYSFTPAKRGDKRAFDLLVGTEAFVAAQTADLRGLPTQYRLENAYPNPFNTSTTIEYQLPKASDTRVQIFNILGQRVREMVNERQEIGYYKLVWDGRNDNDLPVSTGVYIVMLRAGDFGERKKITLLR